MWVAGFPGNTWYARSVRLVGTITTTPGTQQMRRVRIIIFCLIFPFSLFFHRPLFLIIVLNCAWGYFRPSGSFRGNQGAVSLLWKLLVLKEQIITCRHIIRVSFRTSRFIRFFLNSVLSEKLRWKHILSVIIAYFLIYLIFPL